VAADARVVTESLEVAVRHTDPATRIGAVWALTRIQDELARPRLIRSLRDPNREVRSAASMGLGALGATPELLAAVAVEEDDETRAEMLWDLGRTGQPEVLEALRHALEDPSADVRAGAARGLGAFGLVGGRLDEPTAGRLSVRLADESREVRRAAAFAFSRLEPQGDQDGARGALQVATADEDPDVRRLSIRALQRYQAVDVRLIAARTEDPDWVVAVRAFRALGQMEQPGAFSAALRSQMDRLEGPEVDALEAHRIGAAASVSRETAEDQRVFSVARQLLERLGDPPPDQPVTRAWGLAHCAAARLVDKGRGWPNEVERCGLEQVEDWERKVWAAELIGALEGADDTRASYLARLPWESNVRVGLAVVAAAASLPTERGARELIVGGLRGEDVGLIAASAEAFRSSYPNWEFEAEARSFASVRPAGAPEPRIPNAEPRPSEVEVRRALEQAWETVDREGNLEALISWIGAVGAFGDRRFAAQIGPLSHHQNVTVRDRASETLEQLGAPPPDGQRQPVPNPLGELSPGMPTQVQVDTNRGTIRIDLHPDHAPTTVHRFLDLARRGSLDGLTFHRVVPGFVIQGGDPRGDGYGGPGWSQRCEDNRLRYERGTVGMALAGRDTGGSQFFIAQSAQPHLDGRYTAFGTVREGMDVVDQMLPSDLIHRVSVIESQ
ncbi:MAG: peptidylprolyl isomerase, partial [Myxococcota bacterium]